YIPHYFASCFTHTAPTQIHPLSLHDALPISPWVPRTSSPAAATRSHPPTARPTRAPCPTSATNRASEPPAARSRQALIHLRFFSDRKSTRLNSSHVKISYAVFCLKKKT